MKKIFILISIILISQFRAFAQGFVNQGSVISITSNSILTIRGSLFNNGEIINNGSILVSSDWSNYKNYEAEKGEVILNGTSFQHIRNGAQSIYNLTVEGGGEKILLDECSISGSLILKAGIVSTEVTKKLIIQDQTTIIGGSDKSFINGPLYHKGLGRKFYPIGKNRHYTPVELLNIKGNLPIIGIEMFEPNLTLDSDLFQVSGVRYYEQSIAGGSYEGSLIKLTVLGDENFIDNDINKLVVVQSNSLDEKFINIFNTRVNEVEKTIISGLPATDKILTLGLPTVDKVLVIPNVFSPRSSSAEDKVVKIYGKFISKNGLLFRVYNRWGDLVYESSSLEDLTNKGWDGLNFKTANIESVGVYKYTLKGAYIDGEKIDKVGSILLLE